MHARALAPVGAAALWSISRCCDLVPVAVLVGAAVLAFGFWAAALISARRIAATP